MQTKQIESQPDKRIIQGEINKMNNQKEKKVLSPKASILIQAGRRPRTAVPHLFKGKVLNTLIKLKCSVIRSSS
jgi:hypothetical protein